MLSIRAANSSLSTAARVVSAPQRVANTDATMQPIKDNTRLRLVATLLFALTSAVTKDFPIC